MDFIYEKEKSRNISFPLGGIGAGCIGLSGSGRLIDWEIYNRPNKGSLNGFTHFAIKAENETKVIDARVLNGDWEKSFTGQYQQHFDYKGFGYGPFRETMAGVPNFKNISFKGEFPLAEISFSDPCFPGEIQMTAFNPFIPLNDKDSSLPMAGFEINIHNTSKKDLSYTVNFAVQNPLLKQTINKFETKDNINIIKMYSSKYSKDDLKYGNAAIATDCSDVSFQEYWFRGSWFDSLEIYWREFTKYGKIKNRHYNENADNDMCVLAATCKVKASETKKLKFVLSWYFPNCSNYWKKCNDEVVGNTWKNYYAKLFSDSYEVAKYCLVDWDRMFSRTKLFKDTLFSSTLPNYTIDAISSNLATLKSPTCVRLENGEFYGFEGCGCTEGCCEGSCTHVWNYAYALPFLFPKLERSMRELDYKYNQRNDGGMCFRLQLPLGRDRTSMRPCVDGQFGGVLKTYREWKICGDTDWLQCQWESVKKSIEFAWSTTNLDKWDPDKCGVITGRQHHTLDMELFGPNSWLTGFYLAALKAGAEMANALGENNIAKEYTKIFTKGKEWVDKYLFNGEYYQQNIDLEDKSILEKFNICKDNPVTVYWNDESKEIKYQIGEGCIIDQVLAQWHANLIGLGEIFDKKQTNIALQSLYKYNYKISMRNYFNPCRLYSLNDEAGVVICDWPKEKYKPIVPIPYSEETMNGFEYQVAIHMIQEGMVDEGLRIVKSIRERYDGQKRNPWNEFECGSNYARSMASYALLIALSGFKYDMVKKSIGFDPIINKDNFRCFWSIDSAWGFFECNNEDVKIVVLYGELSIKDLKLSFLGDKIKSIELNNIDVNYINDNGNIRFSELIEIDQDAILKIKRK